MKIVQIATIKIKEISNQYNYTQIEACCYEKSSIVAITSLDFRFIGLLTLDGSII